MKKLIIIAFWIFTSCSTEAQEVLFANYFDINLNQTEGKAVFGKINLKRNKDIGNNPIPKDYHFVIDHSDTDIFNIETAFDNKGRIFGVLKVAPGKNTKNSPSLHNLRVLLKQESKVLSSVDIVIHVVKKTMWEDLIEGYYDVTVSNSRLYGRKKYSDPEILNLIKDLEENNGHFSFTSMYNKHPSEYRNAKELDHDWEAVVNCIGGMGYSYAKSVTYGKTSGNVANTQRLKRAIYKAVIQFTNNIPIEGNDVIVNGQPIGSELGDGFSKLGEHRFATHGLLTHQWRLTDGLAAPLVHIWPEVLKDLENGDKEAQKLYESVIRYYQLFFSIVPGRRAMNDISERWKNISDEKYSEGAWADANIAHRMRTLMVMPLLWIDYNRPITYVPYWYDDYFNGTEFEGMTFADNWSPQGVVSDVRNWCDKLSLPSHMFNQSGFHPDGTVTHHSGHNASDVAMLAYGFEWLTVVNNAINYFKNTVDPLRDENYQFLADRINYSYRRMVYKNSLDFVVAGRSFFSDLSDFGSNHVNKAITDMLEGKSATTIIDNEDELIELRTKLGARTHTHSETTAFWNGDYLMHRKEDKQISYYFSVKHKSVRTSGAEDFTKVRKSWHAGSGVFFLRVDGNEYDFKTMAKSDWHVLPGVTEAWETDPMPTGPASAALPGKNEFSGVLSNGSIGLAGYHHKPADSYTSANALKSTHLIGNLGVALGSSIQRKKSSKKTASIVTCIDQSELNAKLIYAIDGETYKIKSGENVRLEIEFTNPIWMHHKNKGYLIYPNGAQKLFIQTGNEINVTATDIKNNRSKNYIIALDHGVNPDANKSGYNYVLVANVKVDEMPKLLKSHAENMEKLISPEKYHALSLKKENLKQVVFYKAGTVSFKNYTITSDKPALIMLKDKGGQVELSFTDPLHSLATSEVTIQISEKLKEGTYSYSFPGINTRKGETALVKSNDEGTTIRISLPDSSDGEFYNYQEQMYAGAPIVLLLDK